MKPFRIAVVAAVVACAAVVGFAPTLGAATGAEDTLTSARDLYAAASYEDALSVLNRLRAAGQGDELGAIDQYRAFCLLALGRNADAEQAIEAVVHANPFYQPSSDVSPRVRTTFTDVRRRMLPGIVQERYALAKAAYERKEFITAETGFKQVLAVLSDPDVGAAAALPPLADIRTLASGFRDLSATAAIPPPLPAAPTPMPVAVAPRLAVPQVFGPDDPGVQPPAIVRQGLPAFEYQFSVPPSPGSVEIVIGENGTVESAMIRKSILPKYDSQVIEATRSWQYRPATLNGVPVKYRKIVNISVKK